jgi:hypothetical protein
MNTPLLIPAPLRGIRLSPSLVQEDASSQTVCDLGTRDAVPEENREGEWASSEKEWL